VIGNILIASSVAIFAYWLSGSRTSVYLIYFLSFIPFFTLDASAGGLTEVSGLGGGNVMFKMVLRLLCTGFYLALLLRRVEVFRELWRPHSLPILAFVTWSLVWLHRCADPWISLFRLGELMAFYLAGLALFLEYGRFHGPRAVARLHCLAPLTLQLVVLWFAETEPELAYHVDTNGLKRIGHKLLEANSLGFASAICMLWAVHELREKREHARHLFFERIVPVLVLGVSVHVQVQARSRTAMITLIIAMAVLWAPYYTPDRKQRAAFVGFVASAVGIALFKLNTIVEWFLRGDRLEDLESGTGRTGLWAALVDEQVPLAPLAGAGYLNLGPRGTFLHDGHWWSNAHNSYMFALVSNGIPGLLLVMLIAVLPLWMTFRRVLLSRPEERSSWNLLLAVQLVVLLASITHFGISGYPNPAMLFHYCLYPYVCAAPWAHKLQQSPTRVPLPTRVQPTGVAA
tara:strand:- start:12903 stop:14276 length:1374 start_codon:yes stop_codon:yes gene_type:complete